MPTYLPKVRLPHMSEEEQTAGATGSTQEFGEGPIVL